MVTVDGTDAAEVACDEGGEVPGRLAAVPEPVGLTPGSGGSVARVERSIAVGASEAVGADIEQTALCFVPDPWRVGRWVSRSVIGPAVRRVRGEVVLTWAAGEVGDTWTWEVEGVQRIADELPSAWRFEHPALQELCVFRFVGNSEWVAERTSGTMRLSRSGAGHAGWRVDAGSASAWHLGQLPGRWLVQRRRLPLLADVDAPHRVVPHHPLGLPRRRAENEAIDGWCGSLGSRRGPSAEWPGLVVAPRVSGSLPRVRFSAHGGDVGVTVADELLPPDVAGAHRRLLPTSKDGVPLRHFTVSGSVPQILALHAEAECAAIVGGALPDTLEPPGGLRLTGRVHGDLPRTGTSLEPRRVLAPGGKLVLASAYDDDSVLEVDLTIPGRCKVRPNGGDDVEGWFEMVTPSRVFGVPGLTEGRPTPLVVAAPGSRVLVALPAAAGEALECAHAPPALGLLPDGTLRLSFGLGRSVAFSRREDGSCPELLRLLAEARRRWVVTRLGAPLALSDVLG